MKQQGNDYVYDIELFPNFFCVCLRSFPDGETRMVFEISQRKDDRVSLLEFLKESGLRMIGFNNCRYDYTVLHRLMEAPEIAVGDLHALIQKEIFESEDNKGIWPNDRRVFQIDLYKINHYDNPAKATSLKWLQFTSRWYKMQDLPVDPTQPVDPSKFYDIVQYCWNDVDSTFEFAMDCMDMIHFREEMSERFETNMMDKSDVAIGEYINRVKYLKRSGKKWKDIKDRRTHRRIINMADVIPNVVKFRTPVMKKFLADLRSQSFKDATLKKDPFVFDIVFNERDGFLKVVPGSLDSIKTPRGQRSALVQEQEKLNTIIRFAKGGLHTCDMPRVVNRKEGWVLMEKDVGSMYPRGIVVDRIYPEHLGVEWYESINDSYHYRLDVLKPKLKELEYMSPEWKAVNYEQEAYKLSMNGGGFGKLGSAFSFQYDPLAKYRVTIGGELKLLMLIEAFIMRGIQVVSANTDGVVIHYPKEMQETVDKIHKWWEETTQFVLEDTFYRKIVFSSVNDYMAEIIDQKSDKTVKIKFKGDFEIDPDPHKNNSQRIVPIALMEYFMHGKPLKEVIGKLGYEFTNSKGEKEQVTIYDYCLGKKATKSCRYYLISGGKAEMIHDKVVRYYIADSRDSLLKSYHKGKKAGSNERVNKGWNVQMFMQYFHPAELGRNRDGSHSYKIKNLYYINECMKLIEPIERGTRYLEQGFVEQKSLFDE